MAANVQPQVDTVSRWRGAGQIKRRRTFKVFVQDVLKAVEDGFVVVDSPALAGVRPLLPALEVGVDFTRVGGVLLVMGHLQDGGPGKRGKQDQNLVSGHFQLFQSEFRD